MRRLPRSSPLRTACFALAALLLGASATPAGDAKPALDLRRGDRVSLVGNTLADRMQHDGWLETYLYSRFPKLDLVFRNLGYSGDELNHRIRSASFGSPDQWLKQTNTDVVFAFFGYNESFAGETGLPKFKQELEAFIKNTRNQKYNGSDAPRLVLFSPIAHENQRDPNLSDGAENNKRLAMYTKAMAEVAAANKIPFVDLFHATQTAYTKATTPLTINGVHLNEKGNEVVADLIDKALFAADAPKRDTERMEKIRQSVQEKNVFWFNRYRTVDGFSIYGGRADLKFVGGQTNRVVMQREMEVLDVMTANRDKRIWAIAQGGDLKIDDSNTPDFIPVETNKPGPLLGGKHLFLDGEAAIQKMKIAKGLKVNLFASEKQFPELANPVQMSFDPKGRLWVAVWPTYPHWKPKEPMNDKILIFEDTDGDGKADKCTVFADNLHCPTGFEFYNGGVIVAQVPDLVFLKDTDGDGKADVRKRILSGLDSADTHHAVNSFVLDPGGALYMQEGTFHHTQVETPYGPTQRCANAGVFRYEPRTQKFDVYVAHGFANPHGHVFDRWGQDIVVDGTGANPFHAALFSGQVDYPNRHGRPPQVYNPRTRPCPGMEYLTSKHFPDDYWGNLLVGNVIGFSGILRYKVEDKGASFSAKELEPLLSSSDPNFRPSDLRTGPDGAVYFIDWHNPIIGHMQHNLRDPSRDREHGRIYRVTYEGRPLSKPVKIADEPIAKVLDVLKAPEDRVRYRARIELGGRDTKDVVAALQKWIPSLDAKDAEHEHHLTEALWLHQAHNVVNTDLLNRVLRSPDFRARAAATRVLCYWRDRVAQPLDLLRVQINDVHPRVRLEAIRALSFFGSDQALNVALEMLTQPDDEYLRFTFNETLNTLERRVGSGKLDRKNIAASLVNLLEKGKVAEERRPGLIETITRHGGDKELSAVWAQQASYPPALRRRVYEWLAEAATTRKAAPNFDGEAVAALLAKSDAALLPDAIRLASAWKVKEAGAEMQKIAGSDQAATEARFAAIDGLATLTDPASQKTLRELAAAPQPLPIRFRAAAAVAQTELKEGAIAAANALASATEKDDISPVVEAFLLRKNGSENLAAVLEKSRISADTAKQILRAMFLAGRNDTMLANAVSRIAGLDAAVKAPTSAEVKSISADVAAKGDAVRGEQVFRRADIGCVKCHAIGKAGGSVGPDLGPIGSTSPVDYIVTSILDPNQAIKEEYLTKVVVTSTGKFVTGVVVERTKNQLVLKDATGKLQKIPVSEIEEEVAGKSLMPEGITRVLTKGETLDLIRFVSDLGRPGTPYALRSVPTIQRWKKLREIPASLKDGVPNREAIRETVLRAGPEAWDNFYALVNGNVPLDELRKAAKDDVVYLQGEINLVQAGTVEITMEGGPGVAFWIGEDAHEKGGKATVDLPAGRHRVTARVATGSPTLRVELRKPADSKALFEIVHAD